MADASVTLGNDLWTKTDAKARAYDELTKDATGYRKAGLWGEYGLTIAKRNQVGLMTIVAAGLGFYFLSNKKLIDDKVPFMKDYWWLKGAAVIAIGWYLWRKQNKYATIALAIGASLLANSYRVKQKDPGYETGDAGDADWDAGAGQWVGAAGTMGGEVFSPRGVDQSERLAQNVFGKARAA